MQGGGEDYGVVVLLIEGVGGRCGGFESVGAVGLALDGGYAGVEKDVCAGSSEHAVEDSPVASFYLHRSVCGHAYHGLQSRGVSKILNLLLVVVTNPCIWSMFCA